MLPLFPNFKKLTLSDKNILDNFTSKYKPYSDFYFFSMWSYNPEDKNEWSMLNKNLVIKLQEYEGTGFIFSFLGNNKVKKTIDVLISYLLKRKFTPELQLVPEENFHNINMKLLSKNYRIIENRDNFDYLLSTNALSTMNGSNLHQKKKSLKHFQKRYGKQTTIKFEDLKKMKSKNSLKELISKWIKKQNKTVGGKNPVNENELKAIERTFRDSSYFDLEVLTVYINKRLKGFTIFERISKKHAVSSFQKADRSFLGIYEFMFYNLSLYLKARGCKFNNIEQDLGIPGLRQAKMAYNPTFLKKYTISINIPTTFRQVEL